ncbi:hypothetical protein Tco_0730226 [Tanacetum coccineum]|uniref:Uncharacterized protein n=1 Tax=Tanacetum coccineum TaxID=301880 RepID=A0ABQ4YS52_9ASTR
MIGIPQSLRDKVNHFSGRVFTKPNQCERGVMLERLTPSWGKAHWEQCARKAGEFPWEAVQGRKDKLTSRDKRLDLSVFKLSRLLFNLLSSGSSSYWRSYGLHESIGMTTLNLSPLLAHLHSLRTASLNVRVFVLRLPAEHPKGNSLIDYSLSDLEMLKVIYT